MNSNFVCLFGHKWRIVACSGSTRANLHNDGQWPVTDVISVCSVCKKVKSVEVSGKVSLDQANE